VARYTRTTKKRARELKHDAFRDRTMSAFDRVGDRMEGKGRTVLYAIGGIILIAILAGGFSWWRNKHADEARRALGRAIEIAEAPVSATPQPDAKGPQFASDRDRAQAAAAEFQKVEAKYGDPYKSLAHYFRAANLLTVDRANGIKELEALTNSANEEVAARAKFALALAREDDGQLDAAAALYTELAKANTDTVPADTANLRLAAVYEKQGKRQEAADLLYKIVESARNAKDKDGKPIDQSAAARDAAERLQRLDPARYAKLPPEPPRDLPF
jgi:tetratricopeptide (TPR) repeat protein